MVKTTYNISSVELLTDIVFLSFILCKKELVLVNLISIITKNYIFKCKLNEQRLNIVEFKHKIMWYRSLEQLYIKEKQYHFSIWKNVDFIHLSHTLSYHFVFLKYLIASDILYLIKKAEKRISSLYESNKQKIYD
jgi:hypothetical protein